MSQDVIYGRGGTIDTHFLGHRPTTCTVTIYDANATALVTAGSCTVDPVNTTLSAPSLIGDLSVVVASATGIVAGRRYLLDGEEVTIKSVSGTTVSIWAPLFFPHASASAFQGLRVSYAVAPNLVSAVAMDCQAVFTPDTGDEQAEAIHFVLRLIPVNLISLIDVRDILPKAIMALSSDLDVPRALRMARENTMLLLGSKNRAESHLGVDYFRMVAARQFWIDREFEFGGQFRDDIARLRDERDHLKAMIVAQSPVVNGDNTTTAGPGIVSFPDVALELA